MSRLDAESHASVFVDMLSDASPKVTRASRDVLRARSGLTSYDAIAMAIRSASYVHGRVDALSLVETLSKWPALVLLLGAAQSLEPELGVKAGEVLRRWVVTANRRSTVPSPAQVSEITRLLDQPFHELGDDLRTQVRGFVDPWVRQIG